MTTPLFRLVAVLPFTVCCIALAAQPSTLVEVPGGFFTMGCTPGQQPCDPASTAAHPVTISRFFLATREVTQSEYALVMGVNPSANAGCAACPVENVSWYDAIRFCNKISILQRRRPCYYADAFFNTPFDAASGTVYWDTEANGYRLPTEAEWEYAARAGTDLRYAGSNTATDVGWFGANSGGKTRADTLAPNGFGFYNLSGNVEEWVWDAYEPYANYAKCDPLGPGGFGVDRVRRGGHYNSGADATVSRRTAVPPGNTSAFAGFRIASATSGVGLGNEMVFVASGIYEMGCTVEQINCGADELPSHSVLLSPFYIGKYEVTELQWLSLMNDVNPSNIPTIKNCGFNCPVETVNWYDAIIYCNRISELEGLEPCYYADTAFTSIYGKSGGVWSLGNLGNPYWKKTAKGYRLPTEAEWEFAARGGGALPQTIYSGSNVVDSVGWYSQNSNNTKQAVGLKMPNALGIFDMSGNISEWCWDWEYSLYYTLSPMVNPDGPNSGSSKVIRGGFWATGESELRVSKRGGIPPFFANELNGFRLCRSANTPGCTALASPADGATNVSPTAALSWPAAAGATGYRLRVGTTPGGFELLNDVDNGNNTTYTPSTNWPVGDTVYVMVLPYNNFGLAIACNVSSFTVESLLACMVYVPPGTFTMGCTAEQAGNCQVDESPAHTVTLSGFYICKYEVTQGEWSAMWGNNPSNFSACGADCPVEQVSWFDAAVYCNRLSEQQGLEPCYYSDAGYTSVFGKSGSNWSLPNSGTVFWKTTAKGYRLPTEAEWEYAARGAGANPQTLYSGSNNIDSVAWWGGNSNGRTWPQGLKKPNALGLYDMSGNVWEWCFDWYSSSYYGVSPPLNPLGPASGSFRLNRGGAFNGTNPILRRVADRNGVDPSSRFDSWGFRICRSTL